MRLQQYLFYKQLFKNDKNMEYPTKNIVMEAKEPMACDLKQPYHLAIADKAFDEFIQIDHQHMVEAFKYLQKRLCDARYERNQGMKMDLESHTADVKLHAEGTDIIASAL